MFVCVVVVVSLSQASSRDLDYPLWDVPYMRAHGVILIAPLRRWNVNLNLLRNKQNVFNKRKISGNCSGRII